MLSVIRLPKTIFWKELREQWPVVPLLLILQAIHIVAGKGAGLPGDLMLVLWTGGVIFGALIYGSLLFSAESGRETWEFLAQLPISRLALVSSKVAAGGLQTSCLLLLSVLSFGVLNGLRSPLPASTSGWVALALALSLAYLCGAWASLVWRRAIRALLAGGITLGLAVTLVFELTGRSLTEIVRSMGPSSLGLPVGDLFAALAVTLAMVAASGYAFAYRLNRLEVDREPVGSRHLLAARLGVTFRRLRASIDGQGTRGFLRPLFGGEWRQKWFLVSALLILPRIVSYLPRWDLGVVALGMIRPFELWAALAGALLGIFLFTAPERDAANFFLHHLPIHRLRWVIQRWVYGLVFGALLVTELGLVAGRTASLHPNLLLRFALAFAVCFGLGILVSTAPASSTTRVLLVAVTALSLDVSIQAAPDLWGGSQPWIWTLALIAVWVSAIWGVAQREAFEPRHSGAFRPWSLLALCWLWFGWTAWATGV